MAKTGEMVYPFRLDDELYRKLQKQATIERRTIASLMRYALWLYVDQKERGERSDPR